MPGWYFIANLLYATFTSLSIIVHGISSIEKRFNMFLDLTGEWGVLFLGGNILGEGEFSWSEWFWGKGELRGVECLEGGVQLLF